MKIKEYCQDENELNKLQQWMEQLRVGQEPFLFSTSGSTGAPKELTFSKEQLKISVNQTQSTFGLSELDVLLCPFSMNYVAAKMMVARAFYLGAELIFTGPTRNPFKKGIPQPSFIALVPLQLETVLEHKPSLAMLNRAKAIIIGGAPMSAHLEEEVNRLVSVPIYQTYGMTETLTHVAIRKLNREKESQWFQALQGVDLRLTTEDCLELKSPVNNAWLSTNDIVRLDGLSFQWLGRLDWVINSGGFKIHPERVEAAIHRLAADGEVLVCGVSDKQLGHIAVALGTKQGLDFGSFKKDLQEQLHKYEVPKFWVSVEALPRLSNDKLDRRKAMELASDAVRNGDVHQIT